MNLPCGLVKSLKGQAAVHQYVLGKIAKDGRSFWLQTNSEDSSRDIALTLECEQHPTVQATPAGAEVENAWDADAKVLKLRLSHKHGAVEVEVR